MLSAVTMRNCVAVAPIQARDGHKVRLDGKSFQEPKSDPNEKLCVTFAHLLEQKDIFLGLALSKNVWKIFVSEPLFFFRSCIGFPGSFAYILWKRYESEKRSKSRPDWKEACWHAASARRGHATTETTRTSSPHEKPRDRWRHGRTRFPQRTKRSLPPSFILLRVGVFASLDFEILFDKQHQKWCVWQVRMEHWLHWTGTRNEVLSSAGHGKLTALAPGH
jgi:hypothetical protein